MAACRSTNVLQTAPHGVGECIAFTKPGRVSLWDARFFAQGFGNPSLGEELQRFRT